MMKRSVSLAVGTGFAFGLSSFIAVGGQVNNPYTSSAISSKTENLSNEKLYIGVHGVPVQENQLKPQTSSKLNDSSEKTHTSKTGKF